MVHIYTLDVAEYNTSRVTTSEEHKLAAAQLFVLTSPKIGARRQIDLAVLQ
jgi:hypothetical protein